MRRLSYFLIVPILVFVIGASPSIRRSFQVGFGTLSSSSLFDVFSTTKGSRPFPTMTEAQRDAISTPATGLMVYNSDTDQINHYDGATWLTNQTVPGSSWTYKAKTAAYTAVVGEFVDVDASGGAVTITLPTAVGDSGGNIGVRKNESSAFAVTVDGATTETINSYLTYVLSYSNDTVYIQSDGTNWVVVSAQMHPTIQKFTSSSGTYTLPNGVKYIRVRMVGGGGGGGGSGSGAGNGGNAGNTTFGSSFLVANGGSGGGANSTTPGSGGSTSFTGGAVGYAANGGTGGYGAITPATGTVFQAPGGDGSSTPFGGAGGSGSNTAGSSAVSNTGSAGGGAGSGAANSQAGGSGGGGGGFVDVFVYNPSGTYSYAIGAGGAAGSAGTGGYAGGAGGSGVVIVEEYY